MQKTAPTAAGQSSVQNFFGNVEINVVIAAPTEGDVHQSKLTAVPNRFQNSGGAGEPMEILLQKIADLQSAVQGLTMPITAGMPPIEVPEANTPEYIPTPAGALDEEASEWIERLQELLDIDFPKAREIALDLQHWIEVHSVRLSRSKTTELYQLLARVEMKSISRYEHSDFGKVHELLNKAKHEN
ncbi:MAG: hypothetical protein H0X66_12265 [Verrucomicrobia bacterium]|nr:hypothetical protein [Verrucomicrobiota bacterium]